MNVWVVASFPSLCCILAIVKLIGEGEGGGFGGFHLRSSTFELVVMEDIMVGRHGWEPGCQER